jgi:MerR family mercuric resistance operon transcriptional regulator/MerR family gold-responsive transcriptional activator of gol and ges genes
MNSTLTIGKLAKAAGVNIQTIRYYERRKLLWAKAKNQSGYRLYNDESLRKLRFIKNAQMLGFTLREIDELLNLRTTSVAGCKNVQGKAQTKLGGQGEGQEASGACSYPAGLDSDLQG